MKARYFPVRTKIAPEAPDLRVKMFPFRSLFCKELGAPGMSELADKIEGQTALIFSRALLDSTKAQEICISEFKKRKYMAVRLSNDFGNPA